MAKQQGFDWDASRARYQERRRQEGASEEDIMLETLPHEQVFKTEKDVREYRLRAQDRMNGGTGSRPAYVPKPDTERKKPGRPKGSPRVGGFKGIPGIHEEIIKAHVGGMAALDIARALGVHKSTVIDHLKRDGLTPIQKPPGPAKGTPRVPRPSGPGVGRGRACIDPAHTKKTSAGRCLDCQNRAKKERRARKGKE